MSELGVFLPVCNNGYIVSTTAPQYPPSYAMNKAMTLLAEDLGFSFVLSPVKYRGFGGPTEQWDYVLESFELMAALAEATDRIQLYGSVALPRTGHHGAPKLRRPHCRVASDQPRVRWNKAVCTDGLWPGDGTTRRYQYARRVCRYPPSCCGRGGVDMRGVFASARLRILPHQAPAAPGVRRAIGRGHTIHGATPTTPSSQRYQRRGGVRGEPQVAAVRRRDRPRRRATCSPLVLEETEAAAQAKSDHWMAHADREALAAMMGQAALDAAGGLAAALQGVAYFGITPIIASYAQCAEILDHIGTVPGTKGIMLIFPECVAGLQEFGERVLPLMHTAKLAPPRAPRVRV
jgi:pyrimidine oxygenase